MSVEQSQGKRSVPAWVPFVVGAVVLGLLLSLSTPPTQTPEGIPILRTAEDRVEALRRCQQLSESQLKAFDMGMPLSKSDLEKLAQAQRYVEAVINFDPRATSPFLLAGLVAEALGEPEHAETRYRQACANVDLVTEPEAKRTNYLDGAEAGYRLTKLLLARNSVADARKYIDDVVRIVPTAPAYRIARAQVLIQQRELPDAKKELDEALRLDPDNSKAKLLRRFLVQGGSKAKNPE